MIFRSSGGLRRTQLLLSLTLCLPPFDAAGQTALADRFDAAARRVMDAAQALEVGRPCYPAERKARLTETIDNVRLAISPPSNTKVDKSYDGRLVAYIIAHGGRGEVVELLNSFQFFATDVVAEIKANCAEKLTALGLSSPTPDPEDWPEFRAWKTHLNAVARAANTYSIGAFATRYGGGETLNWLEVYLDNWFQKLGVGGATDFRPSHLEPIFRITPLVYYSSTERVISIVELGLNYYWFGGLAKRINPVGLAIVAANPGAVHPIKGLFYADQLQPGVMLHVRKLEIGVLRGSQDSWRLLSTVNLQLIRGAL